MTVCARDMYVGRIYRLTRDPGSAYYVRCSDVSLRTLQKRVTGKDPRLLSPDDLKLSRALVLCRGQEHVLAARYIRFIDDSGKRRETRAYVAFPPDYPLREVAKPPSYGRGKRKNKGDAEEQSDTTEGETTDGDEASDASRATG